MTSYCTTGYPTQNSAGARCQLVHALFGSRSRTRERWKAATIIYRIVWDNFDLLGPTCRILVDVGPTRTRSPPSHFCRRSLARTSVLVSEVDSDRRAARCSRACPPAGSGARAGGSGPGARAQPASRRTMSHGHWNNFRMVPGSHPNPDLHACIQDFPTDAWMRC